jgi:hypothetical protein
VLLKMNAQEALLSHKSSNVDAPNSSGFSRRSLMKSAAAVAAVPALSAGRVLAMAAPDQ